MTPVAKTLKENLQIQQIFMSHNDMSISAFKLLSEGLALNTRLTDFFFTHNNLADAAEGGVALIQALSNKT